MGRPGLAQNSCPGELVSDHSGEDRVLLAGPPAGLAVDEVSLPDLGGGPGVWIHLVHIGIPVVEDGVVIKIVGCPTISSGPSAAEFHMVDPLPVAGIPDTLTG